MACDAADAAEQYNWDKVDLIVWSVVKTKFIFAQARISFAPAALKINKRKKVSVNDNVLCSGPG